MKPQGLVCTRLADMTVMHPLQIEKTCHKCGHTVGVYPSGQDALKRWPNMEITCSVCDPPWSMKDIRPAASFETIRKEKDESVSVGKA